MHLFNKIFRFLFLLSIVFTLAGCPGESDCNDTLSIGHKENLIKLIPLQTTYNQGDIVTLKAEIPASNNYFGNSINIFEKTNDYSALLTLAFNELFISNDLTFVKGSQNQFNNWFDVPYNAQNGNYEIEIKVKLNRTGNYSFVTADSFEFQGTQNCNRFRLDSNIEGMNSNEKIEFTVQ